MQGILVTLLSNVEIDSEKNFVLNEEEELVLKNPNDVGILLKTHLIPYNHVKDGVIHTGIVSKCEVFWDERRSPAPDLVAPEDIVWLSGTTLGGGEESEQQDQDEDIDEDQVDESQEEFDLRQ